MTSFLKSEAFLRSFKDHDPVLREWLSVATAQAMAKLLWAYWKRKNSEPKSFSRSLFHNLIGPTTLIRQTRLGSKLTISIRSKNILKVSIQILSQKPSSESSVQDRFIGLI
jgi:hypothetical protein